MKLLLWIMSFVCLVCIDNKTKTHQRNHHQKNHQKLIKNSSPEVPAVGDELCVLNWF